SLGPMAASEAAPALEAAGAEMPAKTLTEWLETGLVALGRRLGMCVSAALPEAEAGAGAAAPTHQEVVDAMRGAATKRAVQNMKPTTPPKNRPSMTHRRA